MAGFIRFLGGKSSGQGLRLPDKGRLIAGRGLRADLLIEDARVSRTHFEIVCSARGFLVRDLQSLNGTYVNGARIQEANLRDGDVITAGLTRLEFSLGAKEPKRDRGVTIVSKSSPEWLSILSAGDEPERAAKDLAIVYRVGNIIASERNLGVLCPLILEIVLEVLEAESAALLVFDERTGKLQELALRSVSGESRPYSHAIVEQCYREGACVATSDALSDDRFSGGETVSAARIHSAICAPLQTNEAVIGVIYVDRRGKWTEFGPSDLELLGAIGKQSGIAIQNALLREKEIERERLEHELDIASKVQMSFLPRTAPELPGYQIAGRSVPCMKVGGDYYDFISLDPSQMVSLVADISGHGLAPALLMADFRAALRARLRRDCSLSDVLRELNRTLIEEMPSGHFVTLFATCLDTLRGTLLYIGAGHDPAVLVRASEGEVVFLESSAPPLGTAEDAEFLTGETVQLQVGDVLVLYTDGLWESGSDRGNPLGKKAVYGLIRELASTEAGALLQQLVDLALRQASGSPHDDITAVVLRRTS